MSGAVHVQTDGALAWVTLSHPGKLNAMSRAMWRELRQVFLDLPQRSGLRCVVLQGEGGNFCAGGDIAEYPGFRFHADSLRAFHEDEVWGALQAMLDCDIPLLASIAGACMGAGLELASCCDLRLAARSARFGAPIAKLGFPMAEREAQLLLREAGALTLRQVLLEAAVLDAATLQARGFLSQLCDEAELALQSARSAARIASLAPQAARLNKRCLRDLQRQAAGTPGLAARPDPYGYADSAEHREGIAAFLDKRAPVFD